ncbi:MAG: chromate transporter [Erysipelotrichaceae bacterium]|nr:chromate transporter [Erysipelotrichaceae bacterium]
MKILIRLWYSKLSMDKLKKALTVFTTTFTTSMTANSGYAILAVMKSLMVDKYHWFTEEEMNDFTTMSQSSPGPMAVNSSLIVGYQLAGPLGAFAAVVGVMIPPIVIMIIVTYFYQTIVTNQYVRIFMSGMQAGVVAMLIDVIIGLFTTVTKRKSIYPYIIMIISFVFIRFTDFSMFYLIAGCIIAAVIKTLAAGRMVNGK